MIKIKRYENEDRATWNDFVKTATSFFFFDRGYLEYHKDRFEDFSFLIYEEKDLLAVLPASIKDQTLICHGGLTFGFLISLENRYLPYKEIWDALIITLGALSVKRIVYKKAPLFFDRLAGESDVFEFLRRGGRCFKTELTSFIHFDNYVYSKGRKSSVTKGLRQGMIFEPRSDRWAGFYELLTVVLGRTHGVRPVHSLVELGQLRSAFPENIILNIVRRDDFILAGSVLFIFGDIVHTQYLGVSEEGKKLCAMDVLLHETIELFKLEKRGLSFGLSTEEAGQVVNEGLVLQKESYGARNYLVSTYELDIPPGGS